MTALTPEQFREEAGVDDWTVHAEGAGAFAAATFATGSFARGVALVVEIGRLADAADHHPDVDLRYPTVTVRLTTHDEGSAVTKKDAALARGISAAAHDLGIAVAVAT